MEQALNVFTDGLLKDTHPLTTLGTSLTDALNATLLTRNGNEMMLQNDMGNTLIQDARTGNVMGLSDGFIPVGMKEYGGVLYIASVNKDGIGELGSIPSPNLEYTYNEVGYPIPINTYLVLNNGNITEDVNIINVSSLYQTITPQLVTVLGNYGNSMKCGDLFMVILDLALKEGTPKTFIRKSYDPVKKEMVEHEFPLLSIAGDTQTKTNIGWYNIKLYAVMPGRNPARLTKAENIPQKYFVQEQEEEIVSPYWFILADDLLTESRSTLTIDVEKIQEAMQNHNLCWYKSYPNISEGQIAVQIEVNLPNNVYMLKNETTGLNSPQTFCVVSID